MRSFANEQHPDHHGDLKITGNGLGMCGVALCALYGGQFRSAPGGFRVSHWRDFQHSSCRQPGFGERWGPTLYQRKKMGPIGKEMTSAGKV